MEKQQVLQAFEEYEVYMKSLQKTLSSSAKAHEPIADGKWSVAQMVMHLAEWDRFIRQERLPQMKEGARLEPLPEVDEFNRRAIDKADTLEFSSIVDRAIEERKALKQDINALSTEQWDAVFFVAQKEMTLARYFADLTKHDALHFQQIDSFLT